MAEWETVFGTRYYVARPARPGPGVLVLHAWWGLNTDIQGICDGLAEAGFVAVAPDLHEGRLATTVAEAEALAEGRPFIDRVAEAAAAASWLRSQPDLDPPRVALLGLSLGGAVALLAAAEGVGDAVVTFYATFPLDPDARIEQPVLGHFAANDPYEPAEAVAQLARHLDGLSHLRTYPGTGHWFAEPSQSAHNPAAAADAWAETIRFLRHHLQ